MGYAERETPKMNLHRKRAVRNSLRKIIMGEGDSVLQKSGAIHCLRCNGHMIFEKYYGPSNYFFGSRCIRCGDILDPVILLHRLSRDARRQIPEGIDDFTSLIRKYLGLR
jgi:late competence protein required for DNA uptake (superfamily II DNA/RNA helicase)